MTATVLPASRLALGALVRRAQASSCFAVRSIHHMPATAPVRTALAAARPSAVVWKAPVRFARVGPPRGGARTATAESVFGSTPVGAAARSGAGSKMALAGAATLGIAGLGFYGATAASGAIHNAGSLNPDAVWPTFVQQRVHDTFFALGAGIAFTAAATATLWQMGAANVLMSRPLVAGIGGFVVTIGAMMFTRSIPADNKVAKYAGLALFNTAIGFSLCPMVALGGPLLLRAAAITGGIVGSLSFIAANSPSDKFLFMAGPLSMGLGAVVVASLGAAFFPAARAAPLLMNVSMYGGLALFSAFVLYDTSKLITNAKLKKQWDPVNEQFSIYLDIINIFTRIAFMLAGNNRKK